ncbi:MAG: hypothetical protein H0V90_06880, partial [Blastocatellia bacterium]|nr:hypothetical protein [Blastocatellia bacterium]
MNGGPENSERLYRIDAGRSNFTVQAFAVGLLSLWGITRLSRCGDMARCRACRRFGHGERGNGRLAGIFAVAFSQKSKFDGKNMRKLFALFLIVLLPQIIIAQMKPLVLTHVTVIDMTGASPKSDMTVIISGNLITALGKSN